MRPLAVGALLLPFASACLPTDTRPPPAEVMLTASSSEQTRTGIPLTVDGYRIDFERLLLSVGQAQVSEDSAATCSEYSNANYTRLFDFVQVGRAEKVNLVYALGHCAVGFTVRYPNLDAKLQTGATEEDVEFMRTPGSDAFAQDAGVSVYVIGSATNGSVTKHFAWPFRERIGYAACWVPDGDTRRTGLDLTSDGNVAVNVEMQAEALFRDQLDPAVAMLRFQPFADADTNGDGDGDITLDELDAIELSELGMYYQYPGEPDPDGVVPYFCADKDGTPVTVRTLGDYAYCALAPSIARFEGNGGCLVGAGRPVGDDD
jgi:hypothetical protein